MNRNRWRRTGEIYHAALPLPLSERKTYIAGACGENTILEQEVESLLEADESSGDFLKTSVFGLGLKVLMDDDSKGLETHSASLDAVTDSFVGTVVDGRYAIERELGHGGVGAVYLARDKKLLGKLVVVKVLLEKSLRNEWFLVKFQQEKEALARVDHPGVVGILDTGQLPDGKPYIVMQYVEGTTLRDEIKRKPEGMEFERIASIVRQTGAALSTVHEKKIFHRDLKPENIMLQKLGGTDEQVKIVDFGIAKVKESVIAPSTVTGAASGGTVLYMSPEQLRGEKVSALSDIYSFGLIAYEMVTGRRPFNPDTSAHLADMQRDGVRVQPKDLRPRLTEEAQSVILKALAFDPGARYQDAREFSIALSVALLNEGGTIEKLGNEPVEISPAQISGDSNLMESQPSKELPPTLVTPVEPAQGRLVDPAVGAPGLRPTVFWLKLVGGLVLVIAVSVGAYNLFAKRESLPPNDKNPRGTSASTTRLLTYSLTVQKMRDGKPYLEPFESSGQEIFESGYKFRLNVSSPQAGYLYVINEGADVNANKLITMIYPTPFTDKGSAKLDASQSIHTNWNTFAGQAGTEEFWIVWCASPVDQMENAREEAFKNLDGGLRDDATIRSVREFLTRHINPKPETKKDTVKQQTNVRATGDLLVKLVELEHR